MAAVSEFLAAVFIVVLLDARVNSDTGRLLYSLYSLHGLTVQLQHWYNFTIEIWILNLKQMPDDKQLFTLRALLLRARINSRHTQLR